MTAKTTKAPKTKECAGVPSMDLPKHRTKVENFPRNRSRKDGYAPVCKACSHKYHATKREQRTEGTNA